MAAPPFVVTGQEIVSQIAGIRTPLTPVPLPARPNVTEAYDIYSADIACLWDKGHGNKTGIGFGDAIGDDIIDTLPSSFTLAHATANVGTISPTAASAFNGTTDLPVTGADALVVSGGYVAAATGVGPGGLSTFRFTAAATFPNRLVNLQLVYGGGTVTSGMALYYGDPRTNFRGSPTAESTDLDLRNGITIDSFDIDPSPADPLKVNVAREAFPFPGGDRYGLGRTLQSANDMYPRIGAISHLKPSAGFLDVANASFLAGTAVLNLDDASLFLTPPVPSPLNRVSFPTSTGTAIVSYTGRTDTTLTGCLLISGAGSVAGGATVTQTNALGTFRAVAKIERSFGSTYITTTTAHGLETGRALPGGPAFYLGGYAAPVSCLVRTGGVDVAGPTFAIGTGVVDVDATTGFASGASAAPINRIAVPTTNGVAILSYTGKTTGATPRFTGCTHISGSGLTSAAARVWQGMTTNTFSGSASMDSHDYTIYDTRDATGALSTTTFRILDEALDRAGGDATGAFVFFPYNTQAGTPATAPREGNVLWGACSVTKLGVGAPSNKRQVAFVQATVENGFKASYIGSCGEWTSDDDGHTWTLGPSWENNQTYDAPVTGITPYIDYADIEATGGIYGYSICTPSSTLARWPEATIDDKSTWEYKNQTTGLWQSAIPSGPDGRIFSDTPSNAVSLRHYPNLVGGPCWVAIYVQGFTLYARFTYSLNAAPSDWSPRRRIASFGDYGADQSFIYGGWQHHLSMVAPNEADTIYMAISLFGSYQTYLVRATIADPGAFNPMAEQRVQQTIFGSLANLKSPLLDDPVLRNADGWKFSEHTWTRTGANTFTVQGFDDRAILKRYTKIAIHDGTAIRYGYLAADAGISGSDTTVVLIPHNDGASAGNIFSAGTLALPSNATPANRPRYSYEAAPPGFPDWFTYTPIFTGFLTPPVVVSRYKITGKTVELAHSTTSVGTSNATGFTVSLPVAAASITGMTWRMSLPLGVDNGGGFSSGTLQVASGGAVAILEKTAGTAASWTNSGQKYAYFQMRYEAA